MKTNYPVKLIPNYVDYSHSMEEQLWKELTFIKHLDRPRWEYWSNDVNLDYTYGSGKGVKTYKASPWHRIMKEIQQVINESIATMDSCFVNGYKDGHDHLGWHADNSPEMDDARPIVVISLGAEREIWIRSIKEPTVIQKYSLPSGSAFVMGAGMQDEYQHRIPKSSIHRCASRISLTYRGLIV